MTDADKPRRWVSPGTLYLVATPIGNLSDWSARAVAVLQEVDWILAEDTRVAGTLCQTFAIATAKSAFHAHNSARLIPAVIERLQQGEAVALISDRGMPAVSDPGQDLMEAIWAHKLPFSVIPGPSAVTTAFAASGYPHPFVFWGFLPNRGTPRHQRLLEIQQTVWTQVLFEAPHRLQRTLEDLSKVMGSHHEVTIGRELTKHFEEYWKGDLAAALTMESLQRGELVLVLAPTKPIPMSEADEPTWDQAVAEVMIRRQDGIHEKEAIRSIASAWGLSKRDLYQRVQSHRKRLDRGGDEIF